MGFTHLVSAIAVRRAPFHHPLLHFLLIGLALYLANLAWMYSGFSFSKPALRVSVQRQHQLIQEWRELQGRSPDAAQQERLTQNWIEEEILYREALSRGLDRDNPTIRGRLLRLMRFLDADTTQSEEQLIAQAQRLGLDVRDVAIRRYLALQMRLLASLPVKSQPITDEELMTVYRQYEQQFASGDQYSFSHIFFSQTVYGKATQALAQRRLAEIGTHSESETSLWGNPFAYGRRFDRIRKNEIRWRFGQAFTQALTQAPVEKWIGPVPSIYGWHLIRVKRRLSDAAPDIAALRPQLIELLRSERAERRYFEAMEKLKSQYDISIDALSLEAPPAMNLWQPVQGDAGVD